MFTDKNDIRKIDSRYTLTITIKVGHLAAVQKILDLMRVWSEFCHAIKARSAWSYELKRDETIEDINLPEVQQTLL